MTHWVLGFAFDDLGRVALIRKNKPDWQHGRWNGIGGRVEQEACFDAMEREFREETGVTISAERWRLVGDIQVPTGRVDVFTYTGPEIRHCKTVEAEPVTLFLIEAVRKHLTCIENVVALIELCQIKPDATAAPTPHFTLKYELGTSHR